MRSRQPGKLSPHLPVLNGRRVLRPPVSRFLRRCVSFSLLAPRSQRLNQVGRGVHTAYVVEVAANGPGASRVYQAICTPFRNPLTPMQRRVIRVGASRPAAAVLSRLARGAGVPDIAVEWRHLAGPTFDNSIGGLELDAQNARLTISRAGEHTNDSSLEPLHTFVL